MEQNNNKAWQVTEAAASQMRKVDDSLPRVLELIVARKGSLRTDERWIHLESNDKNVVCNKNTHDTLILPVCIDNKMIDTPLTNNDKSCPKSICYSSSSSYKDRLTSSAKSSSSGPKSSSTSLSTKFWTASYTPSRIFSLI